MTSNDTLQSLLSAFYQIGKNSPCLLYADRGANITTLMKLEKQEEFDQEDENIDDNLIKDLGLLGLFVGYVSRFNFILWSFHCCFHFQICYAFQEAWNHFHFW